MLCNLPFRIALASILILNLAASPTILIAQQAPAAPADVPDITIRANTRLVVVDVVVTSKNGQPITGLKPEDFTVEENGKKQKISVFVPPGIASATAAPLPPSVLSNQPANVLPAGSPTVLLLDATNSSFTNQAYARSQMLKYVMEQSRSGHVMAVAALSDRLHILQSFTSDPQILLNAIRNFKPESQILQAAPPPSQPDVPTDSGLHGNQAEAIANAQAEVNSFSNLQIGYNIERRTLITLDAMRSLARMLGGLQGRKAVVWLTADLPFDLIPEDRNITDAELLADNPSVQQKSVGATSAGSLAAEARSLHGQEIKDAESQLANADIAIYPVDLRGLVGGMESLASRSEAHSNDIHGAGLANAALNQSGRMIGSQDTMREIAQETGGKAYMNENEIRQGVALAVADDNASYSLGYYPENKKWDSKYRNIKIKLSHNDTEIRYRKGYFAVDSTQEKKPNYEQDVAAALTFNVPATQISFKAQAKPTDPGKMRVVFLVDAHTLTAEDSGGSKKMNVNLYATVWGAGDKSLAQGSIKVDKSFDAATYQQILDHGMMVPVDMAMPAGATQLRLAVLDNKTGFIGTVSGPLGQ
jgi:VWFA-related protein